MKPGDNEQQRLGDLWDALLTGGPDASLDANVEIELLATIHELHRLDDTPEPDPALQSSIWQAIAREALLTIDFAPLPMAVPSPNGKASRDSERSTRVVVPTSVWTWQRGANLLLQVVRFLAVGAIAGFGAGFITGLGARLAMRLAGYLTVSSHRGLLTDNDNVVGQITLGGTLALAMLAGAVGVLGGVIYLGIRSRLPGAGWVRGLIYGGLLLGTFGFVVMDEHNPDYRLFGPPELNVMTFSLVYVLFGVVAAPLTDVVDRIVPKWSLVRQHHGRALLLFTLMAPIAFFGAIALLFAVVFGTGGSIVIVLGLGVIAPLIWWGLRRYSLGRSHWRWLQPAFAGYAVVGASCLIGFVLTARGIAGILGVG